MRNFLTSWRTNAVLAGGVPHRAVRNGVGVMLVATVIAACTEPLTSPESTRLPPSRVLSATSAETRSEITVWDASGLSFTLNVTNQEIQRGDGLVIELSPEETAEAASAFLTIVAGDQVVAAVETSPPPKGDCPTSDPSCVEPTGGTLQQSSTQTLVTRLAGSHPSSQRGGRFGSHVVRRAPPGRPIKSTGNNSGIEAMTDGWPSNCLDVATAIYEKMPEYNDSRRIYTNVLKDMWPPVQWEDGSPRIKLKDYPETLVALGLAFHRLQSAELQLNIMAGLYSSMGCWDNSWQDFGGVGSSSGGGGSLGGGYTLVCHTETWEISYDGGVTWYFFAEVSVCEYKHSQ